MRTTDCLKVTIGGMVVTGVWLPKKLENSRWKLLYYIYGILFQVFMFGGLILNEFWHLFQVFDDAAKALDVSLLLLTHLAQVAKVFAVTMRQNRIKRLLTLLDSKTFTSANPNKNALLAKTSVRAYLVSKTLFVSSFFTALMWGVFPILKPQLSLPLGYPRLSSGSFAFGSMYFYQLLSITLNAIGDACEDFLVGGLTVLASAQIDQLNYDLIMIGKLKWKNPISKSDKDYKLAVSCVKLHQQIISFTKELNSLFGMPVIIQFFASYYIIGITAFKITISKEPLEIVTMTLYLICILNELMLFCFSGDIMMHKSLTVADAIWRSNWTDTSISTQKTLQMMIMRSQRPLTVTAGKIFLLSLGTFTTILKSSYSYFAVLHQKLHA